MTPLEKQRSFRIVSISQDGGFNFETGVYHGRGPGQAALKAFNWYCRKINVLTCTREFVLEEITRKKQRKQFHYTGTRKKRDEPKIIKRNGTEYSVNYDTYIKKMA